MATNAYAPYSPQIQGDSWVPIIEDPYELSVSEERGYWFNLSASSTIVTARIYNAQNSPSALVFDTPGVNIYAEGGERLLGPIRQVTIPATFVANPFPSDASLAPSGANSNVSALYSPGDGSIATQAVLVDDPANGPAMDVNFGVTYYSNQLTGKRILKVEVLYLASWTTSMDFNLFGVITDIISSSSSSEPGPDLTEPYFFSDPSTSGRTAITSGTVDPYTSFYGTTVTPTSSTEVFPWNYSTISRLDPSTSAAQRLKMRFTLIPFTDSGDTPTTVLAGDSVSYEYLALRVTYCEESRVAVGARISDNLTPQFGWGPVGTPYSIPLQTVSYSGAPTLAAGNYVVTVEETNSDVFGPVPKIYTMHQLYEQQTPGIRGVNIPKTYDLNTTREVESTDQIPAISLHTSTAVVDDSHGYGVQIAAPVYSGTVAQQTIINSAAGASLEYPLARFYARRFEDTSSPLGLRNSSNTAISASITVADFDALDEIADGWKAVDLTFTGTKPTFSTSGSTTYEFFSSTPIGSQWQVLGARATTVTGLNFVEVGPNQWMAPTTYGGTSAVATWDQGSGTPTIDFRGDLTLMFARMPQVTGLAVTQNTLEVDVTDDCDQAPGAIPTGVYYNTLTWPGYTAGIVGDTFTRSASSGWGTATSGQAWTVQDGASSVFSVNGTVGRAATAVAGTAYAITNPTQMLNVDQKVLVTVPALALTNSTDVYLLSRVGVVNTNMYASRFSFTTSGTVTMRLEKWVAGVNSTVGSLTAQPGLTYTAGSQIWIRSRLFGSSIMLKAWAYGQDEPDVWGYVNVDTSLTSAGATGIRFVANTGQTFPYTFSVDNYTASWGFGAFELQRMDTYGDWQTIMLATSPLVASFNDFEARVGVSSSYRIRACHELDFCGDWSSTVSSTITAPGVTGTNVDSYLLIFTSNARQDGTDTLAYSEIYDGTPAQTFTFLEAAGITLQPMYNRDYQVAYHGTERGGESFSRVILTNNAAISLQNFEQGWQDLRDLAWDSIPYVCVRDQQGSRWLANVMVPNATSQPPNSSLQFAGVTITEVTATPYPVDPS